MMMIGLKKASEFVGNSAWEEAIGGGVGAANAGPQTSSWPVFVFLGIIVSAPYFISRMIPTVEGNFLIFINFSTRHFVHHLGIQ